MPRLSLYNPVKSNNYKFLDRQIKEMFWVGGTDLLIHKYLGPKDTGPSKDLTQKQVTTPDPTVIQDLLFMENRDRSYSPDVYRLRGHYNVQNLDFDLSQFGLFLTSDVIFVTVHYNEMIDLIGRKLMVGDVFELPHLTDYHPLNDTIPIGLRRYYQITDANYASEGFSQTWYPHLWRVKCEPLVDSREFNDILSKPTNTDNFMGPWNKDTSYTFGYVVSYGGKNYTISDVNNIPPAGTLPTDTKFWKVDGGTSLVDLISAYNKNVEINDAIIAEAARVVPSTGNDRSQLYIVPTSADNTPAPTINIVSTDGGPDFTSGTLQTTATNARYRNRSSFIRISSNSVKAGTRIVLSTGVTSTSRSDTGSGRRFGDTVLTATVYTTLKTGPYGTSDNTYATADQHPNFFITAIDATQGSRVIRLLEWANDLRVGLAVSANVYSANGTATAVFTPGTTIVSLNKTAKTITVSSPITVDMVGGVDIEFAINFKGVYKSVTTEKTGVGQTKIRLTTYATDLVVGSQVRGTIETVDGSTLNVFQAGTTVTDVLQDGATDGTGLVTITVSSPTLVGLYDGAMIEYAFDDGKLVNSSMTFRADADPRFQFIRRSSPRTFGYTATVGSGDGTAPNGEPTGNGITFPGNPKEGDYFLRTDYSPQKLFRWSGQLWVQISEKIETVPGFGPDSQNQKAQFINNDAKVTLADGRTIPSRQSLADGLRIQPD
jgi:hypothetical protein